MQKSSHASISAIRCLVMLRAAALAAAALLFLTACGGSAVTGGTTASGTAAYGTAGSGIAPLPSAGAGGTTVTVEARTGVTAAAATAPAAIPSSGSPGSANPAVAAHASGAASTSIVAGAATKASASAAVLPDPPTAARPAIALTFDDGPSLQDTPRLLDLLAAEEVKATFFFLGCQVATGREAIVKRSFDEGHEVANHTWNHKILAKSSEAVVRDELTRTSQQLAAITGRKPVLMRPPTGALDETTRRVSRELGLAVISWSWQSCPEDWNHRGEPSEIADHVVKNAANGHIVLLHDTNSTTVDAMPRIIKGLKERGFRFMTVSELLAYQGAGEPVAGNVYYQFSPKK